jgi:hypothetical protein
MTNSSDPSQSLWISNKYEKDMTAAMTEYVSAAAEIARTTSDPEQIREQMEELKAEMIESTFTPLAEKYVTMSVKQGIKFSNLQLKKRNAKKT